MLYGESTARVSWPLRPCQIPRRRLTLIPPAVYRKRNREALFRSTAELEEVSMSTVTEMVGTEYVAEQWGVSPRYVRQLLKDGRIEGAVKVGGTWMMPYPTTVKPKTANGKQAGG